MPVTNPSEPFEFSPTTSNPWAGRIISLVFAAAFGSVALAHYKGYFELPPELSTLPLDPILTAFALFSLLSAIRSFSRKQVYRVDPMKQTIQEKTAGTLGTRYGEEIPFDRIDHIQVIREKRGTSNSKTIYYPVYIHGKAADPRQVFISTRYQPARIWGERLAAAVKADLHDDSQPGETRIRKPEELDETVREKLSKGFSHRPQPTAPTLMHARLQPGMNQLEIEIPPFDLNQLGRIKKGVWALLAVLAAGAVASYYFDLVPLLLFALFAFLAMVYVLVRSETVTLTPDCLSLRAGAFFLKRTKRIPLSELEELYLSNATREESDEADQLLEDGEVSSETHGALESILALGSSLVARSDRQSITFGRILSQDELDFILYELEGRIRS